MEDYRRANRKQKYDNVRGKYESRNKEANKKENSQDRRTAGDSMKVIHYFLFSFTLGAIGVIYSAKPTSLIENIANAMLIFGVYWCGMCADRMYLEYKKDLELRRIT